MLTLDCLAISLRAVATPPRVGSLKTWIWSETDMISLTRLFNGAVSLFRLVLKPSSPRASRTAMPWSPIVPEMMTRSPGLASAPPMIRAGFNIPTPVVDMYNPSASPWATTLVSPLMISIPASSDADFMELTTDSRIEISKPSSRMKLAER